MLIPYDLHTQPFTIRTKQFAQELVKRGHSVQIFYKQLRSSQRKSWSKVVMDLPEGCEVKLHPRMWRPRDWQEMTAAIRQADVVHFQKTMPPCIQTALVLGRWLKKPIHQDWDDSMEAYCSQQATDTWRAKGPLVQRVKRTVRALLGTAVLGSAERLVPRTVDTIGAASMDLRKKSLDWGCAPEDLFPARVGVDSTVFNPEMRDEELRRSLGLTGPTVLFAGSFDVHPDLLFFAEALRVLFRSAPEAQCLIVGGGPGRERLRGLLGSDLPPHGVVMTDGLVPFQQMPKYVASCDISALPFRDTPVNRCKSSLTLLESMASGLACVTHDVGDIGWMLGDGGVLAPIGDAEAFGTALASLALDPKKCAELGRKARARAAESFSWAKSVDYLEAAYYRGLTKRPALGAAS
jgi:glycosyltransferase involved in cell wall biosynthesis